MLLQLSQNFLVYKLQGFQSFRLDLCQQTRNISVFSSFRLQITLLKGQILTQNVLKGKGSTCGTHSHHKRTMTSTSESSKQHLRCILGTPLFTCNLRESNSPNVFFSNHLAAFQLHEIEGGTKYYAPAAFATYFGVQARCFPDF